MKTFLDTFTHTHIDIHDNFIWNCRPKTSNYCTSNLVSCRGRNKPVIFILSSIVWACLVTLGLALASCNQSVVKESCSDKTHELIVGRFAFLLPACYELYELDPNKYVQDKYVQVTIARADTVKLEVGYTHLASLDGFDLKSDSLMTVLTDTIQEHYLRYVVYAKKSYGLANGYHLGLLIIDLIPNANCLSAKENKDSELTDRCHEEIFYAWTRKQVCLSEAERDLFIKGFKKSKIIEEKPNSSETK